MHNRPLISITDLTVEFPSAGGSAVAVGGVSFQIFPGEIVVLVGESGSGKSVSALSIMQLVGQGGGRISEGSIVMDTANGLQDITMLNEMQMTAIRGREMGMVFQEPMSALNPAMTCGRQISEVIHHHLHLSAQEVFERCINLLEETGIDDPVDAMLKYPHQFSGGQKQRVMLAMALAADPRLLIADEPTTALDTGTTKKINQLIRKISHERKLAVLYITHDIESLRGLADRVLVMYAGKIVEQGEAQHVFENPQHPYTRGLLACRPPKSGRYYFLPTTDDFMRISTDGQGVQAVGNIAEVFSKLAISADARQRSLQKIYADSPLLKVEAITKSYVGGMGGQRNEVLRGAGFDLFKGETLGLVGASGSGKTTLARCITGLEKPDSGHVLLKTHGTEKYTPAPPLREMGQRVQYIFQDPYASFNPAHTIGDALREPLEAMGWGNWKQRREMAIEMLATVGLKPFHYARYPDEFSGGQRQRIAVARALLMNPEIIICDEAVSALDVSMQAKMLNLLSELKYEKRLSYLFISHDMDVVRHICDRVLVMSNGAIVEEGETDTLFSSPQSVHTRALLV